MCSSDLKQKQKQKRQRQDGERPDKTKVHKTEMAANSKESGIWEKELQGVNDLCVIMYS